MRRTAFALLSLVLLACAETAPGAPGTAEVGQPVPPYAAPTLAGDTLALAALRGSPVVLNIWATWCPPCREEMPSLERLHRDYAARGVRVVAVSVDNQAARDAVSDFVREYDLSFTVLHDPADRVGAVFRNVGVPETWLIDREGRVTRRWIGAIDADDATFREAVDATL